MSQPEVHVPFDRPLHSGHGGARAGAGRIAGPAYAKSDDQKDLDRAKARHESIKANLAELEYRQRTGELVARDQVKVAAATILATLAQGLRSIPDNLERKMNVAPDVAETVGAYIDSALNDLADSLEMLTGAGETPPVDDAV